jgi:hypothetical protein
MFAPHLIPFRHKKCASTRKKSTKLQNKKNYSRDLQKLKKKNKRVFWSKKFSLVEAERQTKEI